MKKTARKLSATILSVIMALGTFALAACGGNSTSAAKTFAGIVKSGDSEVKVYTSGDKGDYRTVTFEETNDLCYDNEGMGWVILEEPLYGGLPSLGYEGTFPEVKNISLSTGWSVIETTPGVYDWTELDKTVEYWAGQGKMINLRLCTDGLTLNQGVINGCPAWLFEAPYKVPQIINNSEIYADLSSKAYQQKLAEFLAVFADHFMSEDYPWRDAIEVVELRGYGMVGEWHSGWNTYGSVEERVTTLRKIISMWREAWEDKLLVISCTYEFLQNMWGVVNPPTYAEFMYNMGYDYALTLDNITFRRDGIAFSLLEYDGRLANDYFYLNTGLPLLGEIGDGYHKHLDNSAYPVFESMNEALHKWRVNYNSVIGWVAQDFETVVEQETPLVEYFNRYMGYRLVPDRVNYSSAIKSGDKFYMNALFTNKAMGRCYKDYDLAVYFEDESGNTVYKSINEGFSPVAINGGETHFFNLEYDVPAGISAGEYTVKFAIVNKKGEPAIEMPIPGNDGNKKYYLGKVTVGDTAAKKVVSVDNCDNGTMFTAVGEGMITSRLVTVNGTKAIVGEGSEMFAKGGKLKNGATYYVSFDYKTEKDKDEINIEDDSKYLVGAYTANGEFADGYEWLDVSNKVSHRTAVIKVPSDGKTYYLGFGGKNDVARIAIDNVAVMEASVVETQININPNYTEKLGDGIYEIVSARHLEWTDGLQIANKLESHTAYMLTFDAETCSDISNGGFFYARLSTAGEDMNDKYGSVENYTQNRIGSFYTPTDKGYFRYSFVFNTKELAENTTIKFGVRNMGGYRIKNITLTKLDSNYSYGADDTEIAHNVIPDKGIDVDKNGLVENFEGGVFNGTCMFPGDRSMGIINGKEKFLISGKYSCYIENVVPSSVVYEFNVFCKTNPADFYFSGNTTYKVKFKFKITDAIKAEEDGRFYCLAREEGSFAHDVGVFEWRNEYEVGQVYSVEYEFTTGDSDKYYFMWGVHYYGSIAIDDVTFEKVTPTGATTPKVTKGHAYTVTDEVIYKR